LIENSHLHHEVEISPENSLLTRHFDVSDIPEGQNLAYEDTFEIVEQKNIILQLKVDSKGKTRPRQKYHNMVMKDKLGIQSESKESCQ
jgi:hypothetical protein